MPPCGRIHDADGDRRARIRGGRGASACLAVLLLTSAGCTGGGDDGDTGYSANRESSSVSPDSPSPGAPPLEPGSTVVPPESDRPSGTGGGGGGGGEGGGGGGGDGDEDVRVIEIGGPTLDNTYPTNPFALPAAGRSSCVVFTNRSSDVTVTVRSVELINLQPPSDPGLALGTSPSQHAQCTTGSGSLPEQLQTIHPDCVHADLEPDQATGCPVEVRSTGTVGTDYTARLVLRLAATCSGLVGEPCDRLVGRAAPTSAEPVIVTWEVSRNYSSCLVPRERGGAEFLPEEADGRCPADTPGAAPSETSASSGQEGAHGGAADSDQQTTDDPQPPEHGDATTP